MKKLHIQLPSVTLKTAGKYCALTLCFVLLNFALPENEPLAFPLFYAALYCGFQPIAAGAGYILASVTALSAPAALSAAIQAALLALLFLLYKRGNRLMGMERLLYIAVAQVPFLLLFPHNGYTLFPFSALWQKALIAAFTMLLCVFFEGGLNALLFRAFRCRLSAGQLAELALMWIVLGAGICGSLGEPVFYAVSLAVLLFSVALMKNASAVPLAVVLALPLGLMRGSMIPVAEYAVFSCFALLFCPYGKIASSLSLLIAFFTAQYFEGLYDAAVNEIIFTLLACAVPVLVVALLPEKIMNAAKDSLLFYREHALPRIAINRNRRAVGERLYEVSSLFREIEGAFTQTKEPQDAIARLTMQLQETFCADCPGKRRCDHAGMRTSMEKLVAVGYAKGQVSLVDLSADLCNTCGNSAGLLFACNKLLAGYRNTAREIESARESRKLLAEQAHGVSEILRDIALEQSEEFSFSECETTLSRALSEAGILSSEIFVYGEGTSLTVSMTLAPNVNGRRLCTVAGAALGVPLALAEKIPLTAARTCYVLKRKPEYDAAFGIASRCKEGENASGDTYSVLKIDERRFLVALSDGMGSGEEAREVSDRTLTLLESFYKAKMPSETVLSTVNRLISYSSDEMFSCLDLAAVDLDTGEADIVKIGSPVGFILSEEELRVLEGESLPIGMLDNVHPATMRATMGENDFMLFMSDGVTSAFGSSTELYSYLSELRPMNPQSLAEEILGKAMERYNGKAEDDMTVLAVKLLKTA